MIIIDRLTNRDGNATLFACVIALCLLMLFTAVSEFFRIKIIVEGINEAVQSAVISVTTQNYDDVYNGLREGYSGGYELNNHDKWEERVDKGAVYVNLKNTLGLNERGEKYSGSELEYAISDIDVNITNSLFATNTNSQRFESQVLIILKVPLSFGWDKIPLLIVRMKVNAGYLPKF